jgi:hypothetical protein
MSEQSDQERGGETSLAAMAIEFWKVLRASERTLQSIPDAQRERFASQLRYAFDRLNSLLRERNMSIEAFDGMEFEVNLPASAVNGDEFAEGESIVVERTIEPAVIFNMRPLVMGKVYLAKKV